MTPHPGKPERGEGTVRLEIPARYDREKIVTALANSGYCVWVEEESDGMFVERHFVLFYPERKP